MNGAKYGKGDRPRNNWGLQWYDGYTAINWRQPQKPSAALNLLDRKNPAVSSRNPAANHRRG
jgi:hypothetical protein